MRLGPWICLGGTEITNGVRTGTYTEFLGSCPCPALDDNFDTPADDSAPWYDSTHPESGDFLGFFPEHIELSVPTAREQRNLLDEGSVIGREERPGRIVEVTGWMIARDSRSMWWGERWITEVLRGRLCQAGCSGDEMSLLPFCREADYTDDDFSADFRTLVGAALIDGPHWDEVSEDDAYIIQFGQFQIATAMPWLYGPVTTAVDAETVTAGNTGCELITTESWFEGEALVIQVATGDSGLSEPGVTVSMTYSLDGSCPEDRISASMFYTIPSLPPNASITVDAMRNRISYGNPVAGGAFEPGYDRVEWNGSFCWPVVPACSSVCVCVQNDAAEDVTWSLTRASREL
jgi:hypothetical protein